MTKNFVGKCLVPIRVQDIPHKGYDPNINVGLSQDLVISYLTSLKKREVFLAFFYLFIYFLFLSFHKNSNRKFKQRIKYILK